MLGRACTGFGWLGELRELAEVDVGHFFALKEKLINFIEMNEPLIDLVLQVRRL